MIPFHPEQKSSLENIKKALELPLNPELKSFAFFPNTSTYAPVLYLPQALAIFIGKLFSAPPIVLMYAARLFNLFCWTILIFIALSITPVYKWLFMLLALTPMSVFQSASVSMDALTNGVAFLFISMVFRLALDKNRQLKKLDLFLLIILLMFLTLSRYAYGFLYILFFMIPVKKSGSLRNHLSAALLLLITICFTLLAGGMFVKHIYDSVDPAVSFYGKGMEFIQPYSQIQFVLTHAAFYLKTIVATFWTNKLFIHSFIGKLGWLDTPLPYMYILTASCTLILIGLCENNQKIVLSIRNKAIVLTSICSVIFILCLLLYISWTPVGGAIIEGTQGRYFIPIAPLIFTLFYNRHLKLPENTMTIISLSWLFVSFLVMNFSLISRYYIS